jgi:2-amino-4-hydroxy-6-hydroxymethyldihydropteridine diphosphokinase
VTTRVYVAAGSNVDPVANLRRAVAALRAAFPGLVVSKAYANTAIGFDGDDFINLVVGFDTDASLADVLAVLHAIETQCGRPREAPKWAPRSMDLDVLLFGDRVGEFPGAKLPRPDLVKRAYMLGPLAEIAPDVPHPTLGATIGELWQRFDRAAHPMRPMAAFDA